jgi:hypothetical protein
MKKIIALFLAGALLLTACGSENTAPLTEDSDPAVPQTETEELQKPAQHYDRFLAPIEPIPDFILEENIVRITNDNIWDIDWFIEGAYYVLTEDIDLGGREWEPVGYYDGLMQSSADQPPVYPYDIPFTGVFDGQGHIIYNLTITGEHKVAGFFLYIYDAVIKNTGFENIYISVSNNSTMSSSTAGGIAGYTRNSVITNCFTAGSVRATVHCGIESYGLHGANAGGIAGLPYASIISYCYNTAAISAIALHRHAFAGGIGAHGVGIFLDNYLHGEISNCYNTGDIYAASPDQSFAGGIIASGVWDLIINDCYNEGNISAYSDAFANSGEIIGRTF